MTEVPMMKDLPEIRIPTLDELAPAIARFRHLVAANESNGRTFTSFDRGAIAAEEGYKMRVRERARRAMRWDDWSQEDIGTGRILKNTISGIEVDGNNLLQVEARKGDGTEGHSRLLTASEASDIVAIEAALYSIYRDDKSQPDEVFDRMVDLLGANYPLIGYLWFLKDPETYVPLRPTGLQSGLMAMNIDYPLKQRCSWDNYRGFIDILQALRPLLADALDLEEVALIEAHSFVWVVGSWKEPDPSKSRKGGSLDDIEKAAWIIADRIMKTVSNSNGQTVERILKDKTSSLDREALLRHIAELIRAQNGLCALTGLPLQLPPAIEDADLAASPDRIDSDQGYEPGNIQMVCWFANRWKSNDSDANFRRLIDLFRSGT
jgi:hypothetical protein